MASPREQLESGVAALEAQRALLGDAVVDASIAGLRARLAALGDDGPAPPPTQTLRQVSILFLDVVGSTSLAQRLDPEEIHALMDGALLRCTAIVTAHGGKVLQYAGDSLLAAFGADAAREDDAERAVRCGLALLAEGRLLGEEVLQAQGHVGFDVRVGIHTGDVLLGGGVDAEGSIRGMAVNIAARMEQTAPAGGLRISRATHEWVRGAFETVAEAPMQVKGVDGPIRSYLVIGERPAPQRRSNRGIEGVQTRMVGRDGEFGALRDALARLRVERRLAVVTVIGEAGLGKSRLLHEFERRLAPEEERAGSALVVLRARARPMTQGQPFGLLRELLATWLQIGDGDSMAQAKHKLERGLAALHGTESDHAALLGHLIGLDFGSSPHLRGIADDAAQLQRRGFHAAMQWLRRLATRDGGVLLLLLDDLHWADDGSLEFLAQLAAAGADLPLLMLSFARPLLFERRADWPAVESAQRLRLGPLGAEANEALAGELLQRIEAVPPALRSLLTSSAEGNPFYMEELLKMLIDMGAIDTGPERWAVVPDKLGAARVPSTLTGVLQARLDGLEAAEKQTLQQAAVVGFVFWDQALAAIDADALALLPDVTRRELVVARREAGIDGVREFAFHHQLLHQVTYDTVLKRQRRAYHARVGAWLGGLAGARANDFLGLAAEHFERAGERRRACEFYVRAAEHAAARHANEAVIDFASRAQDLLGDDAQADALPWRWRLHSARERAFDLRGRRADQRAELDAMQTVADALDDDRRRADVAKRRSYLAMRSGDTATEAQAAREAMVLAERAGDTEILLRAQNLLAAALNDQGDAAAAEELATEGLALARRHGLRRVEGSFLNTLALIAGRADDFAGHLEIAQQQLQVLRETGDRAAEAVALLHLGIALLGLGEQTRSRRHLEDGLQLSRAVGDRVMEPYAQTYLSLIALRQGDLDTALADARAALATSIEARNGETEIVASLRLGDAELASGRTGASQASYMHALTLAAAKGDALRFDAQAGLARVALARDEPDAAMRALDGVWERLARTDALDGSESRQLVRLTAYRALVRVGDGRALAVLEAACADLRSQADKISDPSLRTSYLEGVPEHRDLLAAWRAHVAASNGDASAGG